MAQAFNPRLGRGRGRRISPRPAWSTWDWFQGSQSFLYRETLSWKSRGKRKSTVVLVTEEVFASLQIGSFNFFFSFYFGDRASLHSLGYPGTHYVDPADLQLTEICLFCLWRTALEFLITVALMEFIFCLVSPSFLLRILVPFSNNFIFSRFFKLVFSSLCLLCFW